MSRAERIGFGHLAVIAAIVCPFGYGSGQDIVTVRGADGALKQRSGRVVDINGDRLVLDVNGREQTIPSGQIVDVRTALDRMAEEGDQLFAERKFELAFDAFGKGIEAATPAWMRRRLLAGRVRSAVQMEAWTQATEAFVALIESDPRTEYFGEIPLIWAASRPDPAVSRKIEVWLASMNSAEQLIGASHGLTDLNRDRALTVLSALSRNQDTRIAALATAQRWRAEIGTTPEVLRQWQATVEAMPANLQAGPTFVVGSAWARNNPEHSALQLLRIPILYGQQFALAARSLSLAADQLIKLNRSAEAKIVLQELIDRHSGTAEADLAAEKLAALNPSESRNQP